MPTDVCRLCHLHPAIENSHIIPAFVFRAIKSDSPTGYFRNPNRPNRRLQDGDKQPLLCSGCESLFSAAEREFATHIFLPFHNNDQDRFSYGAWLHFFMTSLAWRTLILDIPRFESDSETPRALVADLIAAASLMETYLRGASHLASLLRNHALVFTAAKSSSGELAAVGPNVMIRRSAFDYTLVAKNDGYAAVVHNLAGFLCFLIIKGNPRDAWNGTKIKPSGGHIEPPQNVTSWIMGDVMEYVIEAHKSKKELLSEEQRQKTLEAMRKNPTAASLRFRQLDKDIVVDE